jgi:hypothetical protein
MSKRTKNEKKTKKAEKAKKAKKARKAAKTKTKAFKKVALGGIRKFKTAAEFVYKHRDKIKGAAELVAAVLGTASQVLVKPGKSRGRKRKA